MAKARTQAAPMPTIPMATAEDPPLPPAPALQDLPPPPPKEAFSKFHQQRQASELRRLYRHIHPELRKNLAEAVAEDLADVLDSEEPTDGDVQCMRWIFENWRLDAIGDRERPPAREPVSGGDVQATSRKFEEGSFANNTDQEPAGPPPSGGDVRAARRLFETKPLDELTGQAEAPEATAREPEASGDVQGTRMLFETRPLDRLGSRPSIQEQSPLELRSEIQELKGDVKKTVKLFQTEPLCAIQDAEGAIHEVKAACREEIQSNAVRSARWLFETQPLDAINRDPSQVRVIRGISLEEGARPDVSATRWIFETQPLDAIREILVDEKDFQPSPDLIPPGPDVQQQRHLFETRALDTLKGEEESGAGHPPKEEVVPGDVRSTLWLFEMKPLDTPRDKIQVGHLQRVGPREREGLMSEHLPSDGSFALSHSQSAPQRDGVKGDVKAFKNLFETLPLDSIGQGEPSAHRSVHGAEGIDSPGQSQDLGSPVYAMQDGKGHLHALTSVSREQIVGGDVQGYRWMFETQPLDQLGRSPNTVDVVRGITRQEVVAGDVGTARWLFETQPLEVIHQRERQERQEEEGKSQADSQPEALPKGDVQTIRWLFETCPMSELAEKQGSGVTDPAAKAEARSCTWMFAPQPADRPEGSREQHLQVSQIQTGERQTDGHVFETEPLQASGRPCGRDPVRYCSRVEIPSGQVSRQKEVFQALEAGKREDQGSRVLPEPISVGSVHKFTWLFENCPMGSLAAESIRGGNLQEEQPVGPSGNRLPERQETAAEGTLRTLHTMPGLLHHGGILMEARGPGELCLAKYVLPDPGQGGPRIRKEELVSGELPRIVRQVLRRPDVDQQGLLVQEDPVGQLLLKPLRLPAPGSSGHVEDLDPEFQQLLACGLGTSVAGTGLVMQETEQGLVSLTAYSLQPRLTSRAPERGSVQLLASCIDKGDLRGLQSLRWEPPADPSPVPAREGAQKLPPMENIIQVPPLDPSMGMGHLRGPGGTPHLPQPIGKAVPLAGEEKQEDSRAGQKGIAALGKSEGTTTKPPGPGAPDLQAAMQNLRMATAEAQSLGQQVLNKHKQASTPGATLAPLEPPQHPDGPLQASAVVTLAAQSNTRPTAGGDPRIPAPPRKVSGEQKALPRGLPEGWVATQDGIYTAHPMRNSEPPGAVQPSEGEPPQQDRDTALSAQARSPLQEGPGQSLRPRWEEPGGCTQMAWGPPEKAKARVGPGGLQATETTLKGASSAHHTLASEPRPAGARLHSHNASVPPPPLLPAAVTGPDFPAQARHDKDSIQQDSEPLHGALLHSHSSPASQRTPGESQTRTPKLEPKMPPRKKPQLPPKPAYLSQIPPPQRLRTPSVLSPQSSKEAGQGEHKPSERDAATLRSANVPTTAGQRCVSLAGCPREQSQASPQRGPRTRASGLTKSQAVGSNAQSPEPPKLSALSSHPTSPQQAPSPPGEGPMAGSQQGAPESTEILQGSQQELQGLLSQVQALEKEAASSVDVRALRRLFETVPQLGVAPQTPAAPHKPDVSVVQAFGELTKVSTEVARLREQTLARLLDIEEAVHKALSSISSLQPETNTRGHAQGLPQAHGACKISDTDRSKARPNCSGQEVRGQTAVKNQTQAASHSEVQSQAKVRNHTEARGQAASVVLSTRRPETLKENPGLPGVLPSSRDPACSPTFSSIESATGKLPEAPSPRGVLDVSVKSTHPAQDVGQARLHQKGLLDKAGKKEVTKCSGQPKPVPASASSPLPTGQQKSVLELQTGPGGSQCYGAMRTVTQQCEGVDPCRNLVLSSPTVVTEQAERSRGPGPHLERHDSPLLRQFLRSPARLGGGLAEAGMTQTPCGHFQPEAQ
ncbi:xin actin-binding repeat-containing protein 1 isoform X1 [Leptonychotes weddellii]|uniref:Xin actin-binding repeat-containing protein 1 isoform X1 n=2 Tax=Leptonychotes weddellii TaxID=9713 RepID=A0A2U3XPW6_LEPWE|nr:xin actin-binding repeat-containing protein 1 isoform X1 [Leptonychotes weddellii]XP_030884134.1 xin actin-binding repeat-containing protein 1 isoform X1 [Leptonychotes weddellii]